MSMNERKPCGCYFDPRLFCYTNDMLRKFVNRIIISAILFMLYLWNYSSNACCVTSNGDHSTRLFSDIYNDIIGTYGILNVTWFVVLILLIYIVSILIPIKFIRVIVSLGVVVIYVLINGLLLVTH